MFTTGTDATVRGTDSERLTIKNRSTLTSVPQSLCPLNHPTRGYPCVQILKALLFQPTRSKASRGPRFPTRAFPGLFFLDSTSRKIAAPDSVEDCMNKFRFLSLGLIFIGCQGTAGAEDQWSPSTLPSQTIRSIQQQTSVYHQCLGRQIAAFESKKFDSRNASNWILKQCEDQLNPIRSALLDEKVPIEIADRYLLRKRHQAAREVIKQMMFAESRQSSP
jgi:hypothetical protein